MIEIFHRNEDRKKEPREQAITLQELMYDDFMASAALRSGNCHQFVLFLSIRYVSTLARKIDERLSGEIFVIVFVLLCCFFGRTFSWHLVRLFSHVELIELMTISGACRAVSFIFINRVFENLSARDEKRGGDALISQPDHLFFVNPSGEILR